MINSPSVTPDNDKAFVIPGRLEDSKRLLKSLEDSISDSLNAFSLFGKSLFKVSRNLHFSFHHGDPSFICKLTLNLLTRQAKTSQVLSLSIDDGLKTLSKEIHDYELQIELIRSQAADLISENIRHIITVKANYTREKANYEKICKETEALVDRKKKKLEIDPLLHYNRNHKKKLKKRLAENIKNLRAAEQQLQDAIDQYNARQQIFDVVLGDSMRLFKENFRKLFSNIAEITRKHNKVLKEAFTKELENFENTNALSFTDGHVPTTDIVEQQYLEQRKQPQAESPQIQDTSLLKEMREPKGRYTDMQTKLLTCPERVSDAEIFEFIDVAQKHYDVALLAFEERYKVTQGLRAYALDLSTLCMDMDTTFRKLSSVVIGQTCLSNLCKRLGDTANPLLASFNTFAENYQRFAAFLNTKAPILGNVAEFQRDSIKSFQMGFMGAFRDYSSVRMAYVNSGMLQDKLTQKILEIAEVAMDDGRLSSMKSELDNIKNAREQQKNELRRLAIEAAREVVRVFEDYRIKENSKFPEFSYVVKGILAQEYLFFKSITETVSTTEECLSPTKSRNEDMIRLFAQDEGMTRLLQHLEPQKGGLHDPSEISTNSPLVLERLYSPHDNVLEDSGTDEESEHDKSEDSETKLEKRFGLKAGAKMLDSFACAVEQKIIRQGRMYIYSNAVCFSTARILGDIAIVVPVEEILKVEKKVASLVFDTSLAIHTEFGEIKFISFFYRDKAFNLIQSILKDYDPTRRISPSKSFNASRKNSKVESPSKAEGKSSEKSRKAMREDLILERLSRKISSKTGDEKEEFGKESVDHSGSDDVPVIITPNKDSSSKRRSTANYGSQSKDETTPKKRNSFAFEDTEVKHELLNPDYTKMKFSTGQYLTANIASPIALSCLVKNEGKPKNETIVNERGDAQEDFSTKSNALMVDRILSPSPSQHERNLKSAVLPTNSALSPEKAGNRSFQGMNDSITKDEKPRSAGAYTTLQQAREISFGQNLQNSHYSQSSTPMQQVIDNSRQSDEIAQKAKETEEALYRELEIEEEQKRKIYRGDIEQKRKKIQGLLIPDDKYPIVMVEETLPCTAVDLYNIAFSDRRMEYKGKTYESCWMIAKGIVGDSDIEHIKWSPKVPFEGLYSDKQNLECLKKTAEGPRTSERNFKYTHQVKEGGPFVPKTCPVEEKHFGYWLGPDEFVLQNEIFTSKVPMSDTFVVKNCFRVKDIGEEKCSFTWRFHVEFVKSTMFKGKIAKSSQTENTEFATKIFLPLMREQIGIYLPQKRQELQRREAQKTANRQQEKKKVTEAAALEVKLEKNIQAIERDIGIKETEVHVTTKNNNQESVRQANPSIEINGRAIREDDTYRPKDTGDDVGSKNSFRDELEEEFNKFVKVTERNTNAITSELKGLRDLIKILIVMNGLLFLFMAFKSF